MNCSVAGCERKMYGNGLCNMHWQRVRRHGDVSVTKYRADGTGNVQPDGYIVTQVNNEKKFDHVRVAEAALGKTLPPLAIVHHGNCDSTDNRPDNLVICPNQKYHHLLHIRTRALDACGNANWRSCVRCKQYDSQDNLVSYVSKNGATIFYHAECGLAYKRARYKLNKEKRAT